MRRTNAVLSATFSDAMHHTAAPTLLNDIFGYISQDGPEWTETELRLLIVSLPNQSHEKHGVRKTPLTDLIQCPPRAMSLFNGRPDISQSSASLSFQHGSSHYQHCRVLAQEALAVINHHAFSASNSLLFIEGKHLQAPTSSIGPPGRGSEKVFNECLGVGTIFPSAT